MPIDILMPALSPTMERGNLARWLKKEGDKIKPGDVIAEIETDKATMEVEAIEEGVLVKIVVPEGTADVPVNDVIGLIAGEEEDAKPVASRPSPVREKTLDAPNAQRSRLALLMGKVAHELSPRRSRAGSPRNRGSILQRSKALVRTAASLSAM